jgi:hypothetical protein
MQSKYTGPHPLILYDESCFYMVLSTVLEVGTMRLSPEYKVCELNDTKIPMNRDPIVITTSKVTSIQGHIEASYLQSQSVIDINSWVK